MPVGKKAERFRNRRDPEGRYFATEAPKSRNGNENLISVKSPSENDLRVGVAWHGTNSRISCWPIGCIFSERQFAMRVPSSREISDGISRSVQDAASMSTSTKLGLERYAMNLCNCGSDASRVRAAS